jgi:hypothetical protein
MMRQVQDGADGETRRGEMRWGAQQQGGAAMARHSWAEVRRAVGGALAALLHGGDTLRAASADERSNGVLVTRR